MFLWLVENTLCGDHAEIIGDNVNILRKVPLYD
jgi:hypothetical protein